MKDLFTITLTILCAFALVGLICAYSPAQQVIAMLIFTLSGILFTINIYTTNK
jgi:hypothetical protein